MQVARVISSVSSRESWTVLGDDDVPVAPVERYLAYLSDIERSPNTVKAYAHDLKDWFAFLADRGLDWRAVQLDDVGEFVAWLRLPLQARDGRVVVLPSVAHHCTESTVNRKLSAVGAFYTHAARDGVEVGGLLTAWQVGGARGGWRPFLYHISKSEPKQRRVVALKTPKKLPRVLTPVEVQAVLDGCQRLRDRLLFALMYDTGLFSRGQPRAPARFSEFVQLRSRWWDVIYRNSCGASALAPVSSQPGWCVESGHEFSVGGAGGGEVFVAFVELLLLVDDLLFEMGDPVVEGVDVGGGAEPGLAPGLFTERLGEPLLELADAGAEPGGALVGGEQIGLQRGSGDPGAGVLIGDWICLQRMDFLEQVGVPVEEGAVDSGRAGDRGRAEPVAGGRGVVDCVQHAAASAHRVVAAAVEHRSGACARRDRLCACVIRHSVGGCGHAVASEAVVAGAGGVPARVGMPSGTVWAAR
jgi:Phage integrase, N-terminal SAM-like domain